MGYADVDAKLMPPTVYLPGLRERMGAVKSEDMDAGCDLGIMTPHDNIRADSR